MADEDDPLKTFQRAAARLLERIDRMLKFDSKMTLIIRDPDDIDSDIIVGNDELADAMEVLKRRLNDEPVIGNPTKRMMN